MPYIELHACSAFSFLRGGSFPEQLAEVAAELDMPAMALLDRNGVYGAQRFSVAAREHGVQPIIVAELSMEDFSILPVLVENRIGYKNLCELLTQAHLRNEKGKCAVKWDELPQFTEGLVAIVGEAVCFPRDANSVAYRGKPAADTAASTSRNPSSSPSPRKGEKGRAVDKMPVRLGPASAVIGVFGRENVFVEIQRHFVRGEEQINRQLVDLARANG